MPPSISNAPSAEFYPSMKPSLGLFKNKTNVPSNVPIEVPSSSSSSVSPSNSNTTIPKTVTEEDTNDDSSSSATVLIATLCTVSTVLLSALIFLFYRRKKQKHNSNSGIAQNRAYYSNAKQFFDAQNQLASAAAAQGGGDAAGLAVVNDLRVYDDASSAHVSGVYGGDSVSDADCVDVDDQLGVRSQRSQISSEADSLNRPTVRSLDYFDDSDHNQNNSGNHHNAAAAESEYRSTNSPDRKTDDALLFLNQSHDSEKTLRTATNHCASPSPPAAAVRNARSLLVSPLGMGSPNNSAVSHYYGAEERGDVDYP